MQLFPILLIVIVLAADGGVNLTPAGLSGAAARDVTLLAVLLPATIVAVAWAVIAWSHRRLSRGNTAALGTAERTMRAGRGLLLASHAVIVLMLGWLDVVRSAIGDLVLVDELIVIAPPLLGVIGLWWAYYPIERRIRDMLLVRRLDMGKPVYPAPSRIQYVRQQARTGLLILLTPIVLILGIAEAIEFATLHWADPAVANIAVNTGTLVAAVCVFVTAPLLMRLLLNVQSLPAGPTRDDLVDICDRHEVRVRDLLLWNTSGAMINAAVVGLFGRLRYVLVTDALIETMSRDQLNAVMAHEVGHVRRHHMPWLVLVFAAVLIGVMLIVELVLVLLDAMGVDLHALAGPLTTAGVLAGQLVIALLVFGWISRRFERQADTFAVQHLSGLSAADDGGRVSDHAVDAMGGALEIIAHLNAVDTDRPSWRHGSIKWRQDYLLSIVGRPLDELAIDRTIARIKTAAAIVLAGALAAWWLL